MTLWTGAHSRKTVFTPFPYNYSRRRNYRRNWDIIFKEWYRYPVARERLIKRTIDTMLKGAKE